MSLRVSVLLLAVAMVTVMAQRRRTSTSTSTSTSTTSNNEWNYRDGSEKVNMRGVANLTEVLDNWRFDILNQMKNLLLNDQQSLLPDYARIATLSEALDDLYKEFNALKEHLGDVAAKFGPIETFVDELKAERALAGSARSSAPQADPAAPNPAAPVRPPRRKIIRQKPSS